MRSNIKMLTFVALTGFAATASSASYFDGNTPLLCSVHQLFECNPPNACQPVTPEQIQGVSHLDIDFLNKTITRSGGDSTRKSDIKTIESAIDGKLIIQGIEDGQAEVRDGAGWTISIMDPEGTMVVAVASDGFAVVGMGGCVPKP